MGIKRLGLSDYGIVIVNVPRALITKPGNRYNMRFAMPDGETTGVGTYHGEYGYFIFTARVQDAVHNLYTTHRQRYRAHTWLWGERKMVKHLGRLRHITGADQYPPQVFLRALMYHANINRQQKRNGEPVFARPFTTCLTIAAADIAVTDVPAMLALWRSGLPEDMLLMAGQGKYLGLLRDLAGQ